MLVAGDLSQVVLQTTRRDLLYFSMWLAGVPGENPQTRGEHMHINSMLLYYQ